jgi:hypothetical protein
MSLLGLNEVAIPTPPVASVTSGVVQLDATASSQLFAIPAAWRGKIVSFAAHGEKIEILFGGSTLSITFEDASTVDGTTRVITPKVTTGFGIPAGAVIDRYIPLQASTLTHFAIVAASTTGKLYAHISST